MAKISKERFYELYDELYSDLLPILKKYNPCEFNDRGLCKHVVLRLKLDKHTSFYQQTKNYWKNYNCCGGTLEPCKYWNNGCTIKCLGCLVSFCNTCTSDVKAFPEELELAVKKTKDKIYEEILPGLGIHIMFRLTKEEVWDLIKNETDRVGDVRGNQ